MRITSSVTSVSWIPSEAVPGHMKLPFMLGVTHYDDPPPPTIEDLEALRRADRFRFANRLSAWVEFGPDGQPVDHGTDGGGVMGSTTLRLAGGSATFAAMQLPDLQPPAEVGDGWVRFTQTVGGRTGAPMPRTVSRPPFVQLSAPTVWTTLQLAIHADGRAVADLVGASPFPRHWVYDHHGEIVAKSGLTDFGSWSKDCFGDHSPWGDTDTPALVTAAESALERQLSTTLMRQGKRPRIVSLAAGDSLVRQGEVGDALFLLLDGVLEVEVDGQVVAQLGPGAVGGERALLEGGARTSTVRAVTPCRVAIAAEADVDRSSLEALAAGHRREDAPAAT